MDASGNVLASYSYNAWGKVLTATGSMAAINPIRYRGYYYDTETELYYLQSRYYDPEICRFLNADSYASTGQGISGTNMFAYCVNNPVTCIDSAGESALAAASLGAGLIAAFSFLAEVGKKAAESLVDGLHSAIAKIDSVFEAAREKAEEIDRKHSKSYTVYVLENPKTKRIEYVGRTTDLEKRMTQHNRDGSKTQGFRLYSSISNLTYSQARGLEQFGILAYNTLNRSRSEDGPKNFILGISPNNKNVLAYYVASVDFRDYIYNQVTNEVYNIFEISIFK